MLLCGQLFLNNIKSSTILKMLFTDMAGWERFKFKGKTDKNDKINKTFLLILDKNDGL